MKHILAALFVLSTVTSEAQKQVKEFYLKRSVKQDGLHYQFTILEDDKHSVWFYDKSKYYYWYKSQHVMATQGASSGSLLHGTFEAFYLNKQLAQRGHYHKGQKSGEWLYWAEDGSLRFLESWSNGVLRGVQKIYNDQGQEMETTRIKRWSTERRVGDSLIETRGKRSTIVILDDKGSVIREEHRKDDELHGTVSTYADGKRINREQYREGVLQVKEEKAPMEEKEVEEEKLPFFQRIFKKKDESTKGERAPPKERKSKKEKQ